eukprot:3664034-Pyramimonas_sp.AAC.1
MSPSFRGTENRIWDNESSFPLCMTFDLIRTFPEAWHDWVPMRAPLDDRAVGGVHYSDKSTYDAYSPDDVTG